MRCFSPLIRIYLLLLLSAVCTHCYAQKKGDSLLLHLHNLQHKSNYASDTSAVTLLNQLTVKYLYTNVDSAIAFADEALKLSRTQHNESAVANSMSQLGMAYYVKGDYSSAQRIASELMPLSQKISYSKGIGSAYQLTALVHLGQDNFNDARTGFIKALQVFEKLKDQSRLARLNFDIGLCYDETHEPKKAVAYLDKAIELGKKSGDTLIVLMSNNRFGEIYFHLKDYQKAIAFYSNVIHTAGENRWEVTFAYSGIGQCYYNMGNYQLAVLNAQKGFEIAQKINTLWDAARSLKIISEAYAAQKNYPDAYHYQTLYKQYSDSLLNAQKVKEINYLHFKQQQADNVRLEKQNELSRQSIRLNRIITSLIAVFALGATVVVAIMIRSNRQKTTLQNRLQQSLISIETQKEEISRQKENLGTLNRTKDQLFSVISHDLRSPFAAMVQSMDMMRSEGLTTEEKDMILESFYQQISHVTIMVNNLLAWANSQLSGFKSSPQVVDMACIADEVLMVSATNLRNKNIALRHHHTGEKPVFADPDHLRIILQNLVGNAIKFTRVGGCIDIFYNAGDQYQSIHIRDTGVGMSAEKVGKLFTTTGRDISARGTNNETGAGIGLMLVNQFVNSNNGKITVTSQPGQGSEFVVSLPVKG